MVNKYLLNNVATYRVPTEADALKLRDELSKNEYGTLEGYSYNVKYIKQKGEIVEEYYVVKAKMVFNNEKEPESDVDVFFKFPSEEDEDDGFNF